MKSKFIRTVSKFLISGILFSALLFFSSCDTWMSNDDFMSEIESEVHDANAEQISVYVRYANAKMGSTEPQGRTTMKVDVASKISAITSDDYGFVKWAAFSTNDFPTDKQHSMLTFLSEQDYNENYKKKELPSSVVSFSNPKSPATEVKILSARSDIFIIPIVATRPVYKQSIPGDNDNNVVKNTSIRILFSKPIDPKTLTDSEGNVNYSITSSTIAFQDDENDMEAEDITDKFVASISDTGKMLTLKLKEKDDGTTLLLDNKQRITVTLLEGICDLYGYSMNGNFTFSFKTGNNTDNLAPTIEVLYGGTENIEELFVTFGENKEVPGSATDESKNAPKSLDSEKYTDKVVAQRVNDKLNIYVKANDIIASGNKDIDFEKQSDEENVAFIGIAASLLFDKDGNPIKADESTSIAKKNLIYVSSAIDSGATEIPLFTESVPLSSGGTIYTYDVSSLPDGLIKIDVWGVDMTGNSGGPGDSGAPYYNTTNQDNSFKSIFVVKDTTPIDSANVKAKKQVISNSEKAPYYWYNKNTLNTMELFDSLANKIQDSGHTKLRSLDKNLWWTFRVGKDTEEIKADDKSWKRIHDEETGNESLHYPLKDAKFPAKDGPVDITLYLKDDIGNMSEPVLLDSIMYDNTAPTVSLKKGIGDFVNADGQAVLHASDDQVISQILKVDIGEANVDETGSGIRRMEIHVKKEGNEVSVPLDATKFAVKYAPASIANPTPKSAGVRDIAIDKDDIASTDKLKVFKVGDSNKITSGTLFIYGLTLGDTDGTYEVSIDLFDSALNKTPETAKTNFARDTTDPVINKVQIAGAQSRVAYGETESTWWMPIKEQNLASLEKVSFAVDVSESGSGIKYIKLGKNIEFTAATKIRYGSTYLEENKDYVLDLTNRTIELKDWFTPILKDDNAKAITLENVKLNNPDKTEGNEIAIIADDFVEKSSGAKSEFFYDDSTSGTVIYSDTKLPEIPNLIIEDSEKKTENNPHELGYNKKYTDNQIVKLIITLTDDKVKNGSGVKTIHLSNNALFTNATEISVGNTALTTGFDFAEDKKSVTFEKPFVEEQTLTFTNVKIISAAEGKQTVKAYLTDFVGLENASKESEAVILDQIRPEITNIEWVAAEGVAKGSANSNKVTNQTFKVDFKEETSGTRVIKFDIDYEGDPEGTESYAKPFDLNNFKLYYGNSLEPLTKGTDYEIKNNRYLLLKEPKISSAGSFRFENLQLRDSSLEGQYNIKVTLLDQAENINIQEGSAKYSKNIFIDTTAPVVSKVQVVGASKRSVYGDAADTKQWWMPYSYFDEQNNDLNKVSFAIKVNEAGSGIKIIKLTEDVEFTTATELYAGTSKLVKGTDYVLDTENHEIVLKDFESPKLRGTPAEFTLQNIKLKIIDSDEGNKVGFAVEDFVTNPGSNQNGSDYKVYYPDDTFGNLIYADSTKPEINTLHVEDSAKETTNNPYSFAYDKDHYTDTQLIKLTLQLKKESEHDGSGVKTVHLTQNAEFTTTGTDKTTISVNGTPLADTEYTFESNKSVSFAKVFTEDQTLVFTNVKIISTTDGQQQIATDVTDFVGLRTAASTASNEITLDKTAPVISNIEWVTDNPNITTVGFAKNNEITDQTLKVDFTEATSGAKIIKFDVNYNDETSSYGKPFDMSNLTIKYINGSTTKTLAAGTDYTILDADQRYIKLTNNYSTGSFTFQNIKLRADPSVSGNYEEGNYVVKVTLLDAAENKVENHESITIDATKPIIDGNITIPDVSTTVPAVKNVVELRSSGTGTGNYDGYWLAKNYIGGSGTSQKANSIPLHINIKEGGSGIKVIKFLGDAVLTASTKLCYIDGSNGKKDLPISKYTVSTTDNTITVNTKDDANEYFSTKDGKNPANSFLIIVENVGFNNTDTSSKVSKNQIKVQVSDVAKNESEQATTQETYIYSDSIKPDAPSSFEIKDRNSSNGEGTISASSNTYTNESVINMTFNLSSSEQYGSGYHKFILRGATFKASGTDKTTLSMVTQSGSYSIQNTYFEISEDGRTLTLKKTGANADTYAVVKQAVKVTINNVHLDNPQTQGIKYVYLSAEDLTGWSSTEVSKYIYLDTEGPKFDNTYGPIFVANYTYSDYYKPAVNVYPHVSSYTESAHGEILNVSGKKVSAVYTATSYETTGVSLSNGEVSLTSGTSYGAVLGIRATDNIRLRGYNSSNWFLKYVQYKSSDTPFSKTTAAEILSSDSNTVKSLSKSDCVSKPTASTTNNPDSEKSCSYWFKFPEGKYSAVIFDDAGNCSDVFHFAVVKDNFRPVTSSFANRQIIESPDESYSIYRNADASTTAFVSGSSTTSYNYANWNYGSLAREPIRTVKFVTKKAGKKFKLYLKLGGTSSSDLKYLDGQAADPTLAYSDVTASLENSPIEKYAISTWYGAWPTTDNPETEDINEANIAYEPAVPKFTTFPGGGTLNATADYNSDASAQLVGSYFNYSSTTATWRVEGGYNEWRSFTPKTPTSDSQKNYESGNGIYSYVDSNKNLVIEVPNTRSTPPITVFLRDGCGNMSYVVLGYKSADKVAASFDFDDKLGKIQTSNGAITTPQVVQNSHLTYTTLTSGDVTKWGSYYYNWNSQSGNSNKSGHDGTGETFGFMKDNKKYATYYNTNLYVDTNDKIQTYSSSYSYKKAKLALTLQYEDSKESVLFSAGTKAPITNPDQNAAANTANDYTCRALLYISRVSTVPSYQDIINSKILGTTLSESEKNKNGYRTNWVGVKSPTDENQSTIILDYPEPDYTALGWTVNNSSHEPVPYYIWYIFEDRVGNYEIGKVVNSKVTGTDLNSSASYGFDKWLYDGEAPEVRTAQNGYNPSNLTYSQTALNELISDNNGYVPYYAGGTDYTVWISSNPDREIRDNSLIKGPAKESWAQSNPTWGVTNKVENEGNGTLVTNRQYLPFANLTVSKEITGIRAFCWSTSSTAPAITSHAHTDNSQGDYSPSGCWYPGSGAGDLHANIGVNHTYTNSTNAYLPVSAGNTYAGKYTGTKINEVLPYALINDNQGTQGTALYLHVMDWTGNVKSYRMGGYFKYKNDIDSTEPKYNKSTDTNTVKNEWYVDYNNRFHIRIAGNGKGSDRNPPDGQKTMQVVFPTTFFTDDKAGIKGYHYYDANTNSYPTLNVAKEYLELPYSVYKNWTEDESGTEFPIYVFDNVGNYSQFYLLGILDKTPPAVSSISLVTQASSGTKFADNTKVYNTDSDIETGYGYSHGFTKPADYQENAENIPAAQLQEIWINKSGAAKFHINLSSNPGDLDDIRIYRWSGSSWGNSITSLKDKSTEWQADSTVKYNMSGYDKLTATNTGTYYQIEVLDKSGNATYRYFKLYLDKTKPTITKPKITPKKGSIGKVGSTYYYIADSSNPLELNFTVTKDTGVGTIDSRFWYSKNKNDPSSWTLIENNSAAKIPYTSGSIETIYIKDCFDNILEYSSGFTYSYDWVETIENIAWEDVDDGQGGTYKVRNRTVTTQNHSEDEPISKLTYYSGSAPTISETLNAITTNVGNYIYTYGPDTNNNTEDWRNTLVETTDGDSDGDFILIKNKEQSKLRIILTPPANSNIIGYVVKDSDTSTPSTDHDIYSMGHGVQGTKQADGKFYIEEDIYDINKGSTFTRCYYAVDVVGNISATSLKVTYTFKNPHAASNVELIKDPLTSDKVPSDVKNKLKEAGFIFTDYYDFKDSSQNGNSKDKIKSGFRYFSDNYMVIRCTLFKPADKNPSSATYYEDTPIKVELVDVWNTGSGNRGWSYTPGDTGYDDYFKLYTSTELAQDLATGRYYCWIVFKPKSNFNNNTNYGGGVINAVIYGEKSKTDHCPLNEDAVKQHGWQMDKTAPTISGKNPSNKDYINNGILVNYSVTGNTQKVYDNKDGPAFVTVAYTSGLKINILKASVTDPNANNAISSGVAKYRFDYEGNPSTTWTDIGNAKTIDGKEYYQFTLSDISAVHKRVYLKIKDRTGNINTYQLAAADNKNHTWWIVDNLLPADVTDETWTDATWSAGANDYTFKVNLPEGSIIKKVSVKVDGQEKDSSNVNWGTVKFNGYTAGPQTPSLDGNTGWLVVNDGDKKGLDITVKKIPQDWANHTVEIKINDNDNLKKTYENFVTPKTFTADDVTIGVADENGVVTLSSSTNAPLATYITAVKAKVGDTEIGAAKSAGENNTVKVILSGIPPKTWSEQKVTLYINPTDENAEGIKYKEVLTIPAVQTSDISIGTAEWSTEDNAYVATVTYSNGAPTSAITTVSSTKATAAFATQEGTPDKTKIVLTDLPAKSWSSQAIDVTISDGGTNTITNDSVMTVQALAPGDFTVNGDDTYSNGEYTIAMADHSSLPSIESGVVSVTTKIGETEVTEGAATVAWSSPTATITVSPDWSEKTVILKVNGLELKTITVPALALTDFTIDGPESFTDDGDYVYKISKTGFIIPSTKVTAEGASVTWNETESEATLTLAKSWTDEQTVTLKLNGWTVKTLSIPKKTISDATVVFVKATESPDKPIDAYNDNMSNIQFRVIFKDGDTKITSITINNITTSDTDCSVEYRVVQGYESLGKLAQYNPKSDEKVAKTASVNISTSHGDLTGVFFFPQGNDNIGSRAAFGGFRQTSASDIAVAGDAPKTRSISLRNWVADLFGGDSEAVDLAAGDAAPLTKKEAKKAKKAAKKAAKAADALKAAESSAQSAADLEDLVVAAAEAAGQALDAAVSEAETAAKPAQIEAEASAPVMSGLEPAAGEASAEEAAPSKAALFLAMAVFCAAIAGIIIFCLKKKPAKK